MILKVLFSLLLATGLGITSLFPQSFPAPNCALKSHETLNIIKIVSTEEKAEIYLEVENRIAGGTFCADKNIFIIYPDGTKSLLSASEGIPVCPDTYNFKSTGERLDFVLTFPPLKKGAGSINLIEECQANCFSFYGIILDDDLNKKIDYAFSLAENGEPARALVSFTGIEEEGIKNQGAIGLLLMNMAQLASETGNRVKAAVYYKKLESSGLPETRLYLSHLNSLGIKY